MIRSLVDSVTGHWMRTSLESCLDLDSESRPGSAKSDPMSIAIDLSGRTALVTGSSQGIGAETARLLHAAGARVVLNHPDLSRGKVHQDADRASSTSCFRSGPTARWSRWPT